MKRALLPSLLLSFATACALACGPSGDGGSDSADVTVDDGLQLTDPPYGSDASSGFDVAGPQPTGACPDIYDEDLFPVFEIEIEPAEWEALQYDWEHGQEIVDAGGTPENYRPLVVFRYNGEEYYDVMIRPKGTPFHWVESPNKMQFNVSFTEVDSDQRFHGVRKLILDAPDYDFTLLHDRTAMYVFRKLGVAAPCVNNARLVVNGTYYGVYANIERIDRGFLRRHFGAEGEGNLYKYGMHKGSEVDPDTSDYDTYLMAEDLAALDASLDLDEAILEWAGEAVLPYVDGFWAGSDNFYMYHHPTRGFLFIPWDIDDSLENMQPNVDPYEYYMHWGDLDKAPQWHVVMAQQANRDQFVASLHKAREAYDPEDMQARVDAWSAQIADAVAKDSNKPFPTEKHVERVGLLRAFIKERTDFVDQWFDCYAGTGTFETREVNGVSYGFYLPHCGWERARDHCKAVGGQLALPSTPEEAAALNAEAVAIDNDYWWVGATDRAEEGVWLGPDGKEVGAAIWNPGSPDGDVEQSCAALTYYQDGLWEDVTCGHGYPSVCRLDP